MSKPDVLASSIGESKPHSITFEVSEHFLEQAQEGKWSPPILFCFKRREGGGWDLLMQTPERRYEP